MKVDLRHSQLSIAHIQSKNWMRIETHVFPPKWVAMLDIVYIQSNNCMRIETLA